MLLRLLKSFRPKTTAEQAVPATDVQQLKENAERLMASGDQHAAIAAIRVLLEHDPDNVQALNDLGCCLADTGNAVEAAQMFTRAFSLNDAFVPAIVNHARLIIDQRKLSDAWPFIEQAKLAAPRFMHTDAVYASWWFNQGHVANARQGSLRAWLGQFDNLRCANNYLWFSTYSGDINEAQVASEHLFWAETALPPAAHEDSARVTFPEIPPAHPRIRIGYWSPDLRDHSVRYFFRPLLENHDREKFEIFLYHDYPKQDAQTEKMRNEADRFFDISTLNNVAVSSMMRAHNLDVLVELAGHSSTNRIHLLKQRLARLQLSGIGYPPTTGLSSIDGKWLDPHVLTDSSSRHYTERPFVLPNSFWCFDPMELAVDVTPPPCLENGYITFGCIGNISKITDEVLKCWRQIVEKIPTCRLRLRSINFEDEAATRAIKQRLAALDFPNERLDLLPPLSAKAFLTSYDEIDIVLDTFPFNGGTTTAFALYMGVPIVSLYGQSLTSRMGLSMLTNMEVPQLAVTTEEAYLAAAIQLAEDREFLSHFRATARSRLRRSAFGNGELFARDFETTCIQALNEQITVKTYEHSVAPLPAKELARRAFIVLNAGQEDAAQRIASHCLNFYPEYGPAHIIRSHDWLRNRDFAGARKYLQSQIVKFDSFDQVAGLICLLRLDIHLQQKDEAIKHFDALHAHPMLEPLDRTQANLFDAALASWPSPEAPQKPRKDSAASSHRCTILIVNDDAANAQRLADHILQLLNHPSNKSVQIQIVDETKKLQAYKKALSDTNVDFTVLVQRNVIPQHPAFLDRLAVALKTADIVGGAGCQRWTRLDWRYDHYERKAGTTLWSSSEVEDFIEVNVWGHHRSMVVEDLAILDGKLLAVRNSCAKLADFDSRLVGADTLAEEAWTYESHKMGAKLAVHNGLGMHVGSSEPLTTYNLSDARWTLADHYQFEAFEPEGEDRAVAAVPTLNFLHALTTVDRYFT